MSPEQSKPGFDEVLEKTGVAAAGESTGVLKALMEEIAGQCSQALIDTQLYRALFNCLDKTRTTGLDHWTFLQDALKSLPGRRLLDFGSGAGTARQRVEKLGLEWEGLDIGDSQESAQRTSMDRVTIYDGMEIPFADQSFDVILSIQTFEHVQDMGVTFQEISRVLKPRGHLIGSTSHLEPYHTRSTFNYTPHGFNMILQKNGLNLTRIHPGIDAYSLLVRKILMVLGYGGAVRVINRMFHDHSPLNQMFVEVGTRRGYTPAEINCWRLQFCGTFRFDAVKP